MKNVAVGWLVLLISGVAPAWGSDGFRCRGGHLVSVGDRLAEVSDRCGDPDSADQRVELRKVTLRGGRGGRFARGEIEESRTIEVTIDEWTYDLGRNRLVRFLTFENGRLVFVSTGKRGTKRDDR